MLQNTKCQTSNISRRQKQISNSSEITAKRKFYKIGVRGECEGSKFISVLLLLNMLLFPQLHFQVRKRDASELLASHLNSPWNLEL